MSVFSDLLPNVIPRGVFFLLFLFSILNLNQSSTNFLPSSSWEIQIFSLFFFFLPVRTFSPIFFLKCQGQRTQYCKKASDLNSLRFIHITKFSVSHELTVFQSLKQITRHLIYFNERFGGTRHIWANELANTKG